MGVRVILMRRPSVQRGILLIVAMTDPGFALKLLDDPVIERPHGAGQGQFAGTAVGIAAGGGKSDQG